jgi:hypothetical protein
VGSVTVVGLLLIALGLVLLVILAGTGPFGWHGLALAAVLVFIAMAGTSGTRR